MCILVCMVQNSLQIRITLLGSFLTKPFLVKLIMFYYLSTGKLSPLSKLQPMTSASEILPKVRSECCQYYKDSRTMELFSRRRRRLVSAQLPFIHCLYCFVSSYINTTSYHLGRYEPSSPVSCRAPCQNHHVITTLLYHKRFISRQNDSRYSCKSRPLHVKGTSLTWQASQSPLNEMSAKN